jgi:hypothetical protein
MKYIEIDLAPFVALCFILGGCAVNSGHDFMSALPRQLALVAELVQWSVLALSRACLHPRSNLHLFLMRQPSEIWAILTICESIDPEQRRTRKF